LLQHVPDFQQAQCRILFVSYNDPTKPLHRLWIQEWCTTYLQKSGSGGSAGSGSGGGGVVSGVSDTSGSNGSTTTAQLVLDPTKRVYESWGLTSDLIAAWGPQNIWYYVKAICCRGRRSIAVKGEAGQMGADLVLDSQGVVLLQHYCRNPTDRIPVSKILHTIRSYHKHK
jgi:hypothetical protein